MKRSPATSGRVSTRIEMPLDPSGARLQRVLGRVGTRMPSSSPTSSARMKTIASGVSDICSRSPSGACRLVVDTGIHAKRWTREQASGSSST